MWPLNSNKACQFLFQNKKKNEIKETLNLFA